MSTTLPKTQPFHQHLERVRHCIEVTVTHLTTIKELVPTDDELRTASSARASFDHEDLARHRENLERAMQETAKLARLLIDQTRASAGLDPQCCDWPTFEETTKGEC